MKKIFEYQFSHLLLALLFVMSTAWLVNDDPDIFRGSFFGLDTAFWFWLGILTPITHQFYVAITWRLELYKRVFSSLWGAKKAFILYSIGFAILFGGRFIVICFIALSSSTTLAIDANIAYTLAAVITPLILYLFYSVQKYFTAKRAFGIDHFEPNYQEAYVKGGIFKYTNNGMYLVGLLVMFLPGLILLSKAALVVALFNYLYIWVHYYCTELPDMKTIYGATPKG